MVKTTVYVGPIERVYDLGPFSDLMTKYHGNPITEVFRSDHDGTRYCAWKFPSYAIVSLTYYAKPGKKELGAIVLAEGSSREVGRLRRIILKADRNGLGSGRFK